MSDRLLSGIRVVEMSHMVMGPVCGMVLAQLGAEVIKVEPPGGDKTRFLRGMGTSFFPLFNRGKKSITLDVKTVEGREALERLLATADVFIENFRDGTIASLGLDSATLSQKFPRLVIGAHKGFLSGPYEHRPALDEVVQMMAGLAYMTGSREQPRRVGASMNDIMAGMFGVIGILGALIDRDKTGKGMEIRVGLFENCLFAVAQHMVQFEMTGVAPPPMPERVHAWPVYDIFDTADGRRVFVAVTTDGNWNAFCRAFGLHQLLSDQTLQTTNDRIEGRKRTIPVIADRILKETSVKLQEKLDDLNIPFAPINAPEEMFEDPHVNRPGGLVEMINDDGQRIRTPTLPLELDGQTLLGGVVVPVLGADTHSILSDLGYSDVAIETMTRFRDKQDTVS